MCRDPVYDWLYRFKKTGDYSSKQGVGCSRKFRFTDKDIILDFIDESGVDDNIVSQYAWSVKGERSYAEQQAMNMASGRSLLHYILESSIGSV